MTRSSYPVAPARRILAHEGPLLRRLMLEASRPSRHEIEHRIFLSRSASRWAALAADRATTAGRSIFVLADEGETEGMGMLWCFVSSDGADADLTWSWIRKDIEGSHTERSLVDAVCNWAAEAGAVRLVAAADEAHEAAFLQRVGLVSSGVAADGVRSAFALDFIPYRPIPAP